MNKIVTVTADVCVNYKKLKVLQDRKLIKIIGVKIENNSSRSNAVLPTGVMGYTVLGSMKLGTVDQVDFFEVLKRIIGLNNINDCIHLEAHIREGYDYFVTDDRDILDKKVELEKQFMNLKIRSTKDLVCELDN